MSRRFIILMMGYTGTGKSTLAKRLSKELKTDIFHSAVVRKELGLSPKTKDEADKFFDYKNNLRQDVDKKVYSKMAVEAEESLKNGKDVILDAGHFFKWQRQNIYQKVAPLNTGIFIVRVLCEDENEIKRRFAERAKGFNSSPLNETPSWNTYLATKELTEPPEKDILPPGSMLNIMEYNSLTGEIKFIQGKEDLESSEKIMLVLKNIAKEVL